MKDLIERAQILAEALPYIQRFRGRTFVVKYGGHAMLTAELRESFAQDIVLLESVGIKAVVVHGGGPQITDLIGRLGLKSTFVRGMRVTDEATMDAAEMVLQKINKEIVALIWRHGGRAVGLSGKDGDLLVARKMLPAVKGPDGSVEHVDIGLVGEVTHVVPTGLQALEQAGFIPVIAPIGVGQDGGTYNLNADVAAGAIAGALKAEKLILLTDVEGVKDQQGRLLRTLDAALAREMIASGAIGEGMIPKVECCLDALRDGALSAHVIDGRVPHAVLLEVFTKSGVGTEVVRRKARGGASGESKISSRSRAASRSKSDDATAK
ncbi:MAG TPA: acetylglutamate kinase [Candidatus Binataceae bacterium]|nr:acetylglutamate kinase [Candidatus Binataceae bacterium]